MSLQPYYITSYNSGLTQDKKPFLILDNAFPKLENAYAWRDRLKKREGLQLVGRLRRVFTLQALDVTVGGILTYNFPNIYATLGISVISEDPQIEPGSIVVEIALPDEATFTDNGDGTFTVTGIGVSAGSFINYNTGELNLVISASVGGSAITINFNYFPGLPAMGIDQYEIAAINAEQTILFDTKYAYQYVSESFQELAPGATWTGDDSQFFWMTNYRGINPFDRLFFVTNFNINDPIRYFNGTTWTNFAPLVSATDTLYQARIIIPYYGRLLALNVFEGTTAGGSGASSNYFSRARFSQVGDPLQVDAWRSDLFGKGGFIDAPTNEFIISATFYKNTLIVFFEKTTWQLRYVGDYGLPFIWERISSDFGAESTFSPVIFDEGVLAVGDRAIISSSGVTVDRIDLQIPDIVFSFNNKENGTKRVHGIRDFQKELVYWCYSASQLERKFPNFSLVFNYRNNTYAIFRNNVTCFGRLGSPSGISWDSLDVFWDDDVPWDTFVQEEFLDVISGNQQGYIHFYGDPNSETISDSTMKTFDQESLSITSIDLTTTPIQLTVINHNLALEGEIIYITGLTFLDSITFTPVSTDLNNQIYLAKRVTDDILEIFKWDFTLQQYIANFVFTPTPGTVTYVGGGQLALFPKLDVLTKDFNPFTQQGLQAKMAYLDLLTDATVNAALTIKLYADTSLNSQSNLTIGNIESETSLTTFGSLSNATQANPCVITSIQPHGLANGDVVQFQDVEGMIELNGNIYTITYLTSITFSINVDSTGFTPYVRGGTWIQQNFPYYVEGQNYTWHRFYAGVRGNFFSINLTYDDNLMNTIDTHSQDFILNAMQLWVRKGGKGIF